MNTLRVKEISQIHCYDILLIVFQLLFVVILVAKCVDNTLGLCLLV